MARRNELSAHLSVHLHSVAKTIATSFWLRHRLLSGDGNFFESRLWSFVSVGEAERYFEAVLHFALPVAALEQIFIAV